jgi:hypothetical protein
VLFENVDRNLRINSSVVRLVIRQPQRDKEPKAERNEQQQCINRPKPPVVKH